MNAANENLDIFHMRLMVKQLLKNSEEGRDLERTWTESDDRGDFEQKGGDIILSQPNPKLS